jgi:hypothetical protein
MPKRIDMSGQVGDDDLSGVDVKPSAVATSLSTGRWKQEPTVNSSKSSKNLSGTMVLVPDNKNDSLHEKRKTDDTPLDWSLTNFTATNRSWRRETLDSINTIRFNCGMSVNNSRVQFFIVLLIAINAIMMGIATMDIVKKNPEVEYAFEITDRVILIIFTVELSMQFIYLGWRLLLDGWLLFDLIIILVSWAFSEVQIIRAFRIFRALRLATRIKIMKNLLLGKLGEKCSSNISGEFSPTNSYLSALFGVMPRMAAIGLMLLLIIYIFAVMCTQLFKDLHVNGFTEYDYFSTFFMTCLTLFQMMTLDGWASITREVMDVYSWAWIPIITYVIISGFVVVNLIIAVICDAISALGSDEKAKLEGNYQENSDLDSNSEAPEIRIQLDSLEEQVEDLRRIQERTFHSLSYLSSKFESRNEHEI